MRSIASQLLWCCLLVAGAVGKVQGQAHDDGHWDLQALMAKRRQVESATATFVEHKYLRILMQRLETSGRLRYKAPDWLQKVTSKPIPETFELQGDSMTMVQRKGERVTASLSAHPEIAALVEGMRSTLAGDLATLERHYTIEFKGNASAWRLRLSPRNATVREKVSVIAISGSEEQIKLVEVREQDGDRSEMIITPAGP